MNSLNEIFANAGNAKAILLLASFLGGVVASISPCSLAMLPIVIGYIGGYANQPLSKTVIQKDYGNDNAYIKFFSNNYHIFRAGLYAKMAGIAANGVGAPTRFYFLPNALIREFVAILLMNKKRHIIMISLIMLVILLLMGVDIYSNIMMAK